MKRVLSLILLLFLTFFLVSCSSIDDPNTIELTPENFNNYFDTGLGSATDGTGLIFYVDRKFDFEYATSIKLTVAHKGCSKEHNWKIPLSPNGKSTGIYVECKEFAQNNYGGGFYNSVHNVLDVEIIKVKGKIRIKDSYESNKNTTE